MDGSGDGWLGPDDGSTPTSEDEIERQLEDMSRRRAVGIIVGVLVVLVLLGAAVALLVRRGDESADDGAARAQLDAMIADQIRDQVDRGAQPTAPPGSCLPASGTAGVRIVMASGATHEQIEAVRRALVAAGASQVAVADDGVTSLTPTFTDGPSSGAPSSAERGRALADITAMDGVDDLQAVLDRCPEGDQAQSSTAPHVIVFVAEDGSGRLEEIERALSDAPSVAHLWFVDHDGAMAEAKCLFADSPELLTTDLTALPVSFRVQLTEGNAAAGTIEELLAGQPGVQVIATADPRMSRRVACNVEGRQLR